MSSSFIYSVGLNNVGSYQASGAPFVTSSAVPASGSGYWKISFPYVTKQITITNNSTTSHDLVRIAFSERGLEDTVANYFVVGSTKDGDGSTTLNVKATELYVMCDANHAANVSVFGSLTNIDVGRVMAASPSGSNWSGSIGVG